jgi:hypothetical protein
MIRTAPISHPVAHRAAPDPPRFPEIASRLFIARNAREIRPKGRFGDALIAPHTGAAK